MIKTQKKKAHACPRASRDEKRAVLDVMYCRP